MTAHLPHRLPINATATSFDADGRLWISLGHDWCGRNFGQVIKPKGCALFLIPVIQLVGDWNCSQRYSFVQVSRNTERNRLMRSTFAKLIAAAGLICTFAVATATTSEARDGTGAFAAGVGAGLLGGAAIASVTHSAPGYGYGPSYYAYGSPPYGYRGGWRHHYHPHHNWVYR